MTEAAVATRKRGQGPAVSTLREVRELMQKPDRRTYKGKRDAALLAVLAGGGLRVGEAVGLTIDDVEVERCGRVRLTFVTSKTRGRRMRTVTLPAWAGTAVTSWLNGCSSEWLFPGNKGRHLSTRAAEKIVNRYLTAIGRSELHTHSLRHTFGSLVTRETRSLFVAQKLLGHAHVPSTSYEPRRHCIPWGHRVPLAVLV